MSGILEKLQSIGKALMLPIAVLPAAALLLRLARRTCSISPSSRRQAVRSLTISP